MRGSITAGWWGCGAVVFEGDVVPFGRERTASIAAGTSDVPSRFIVSGGGLESGSGLSWVGGGMSSAPLLASRFVRWLASVFRVVGKCLDMSVVGSELSAAAGVSSVDIVRQAQSDVMVKIEVNALVKARWKHVMEV